MAAIMVALLFSRETYRNMLHNILSPAPRSAKWHIFARVIKTTTTTVIDTTVKVPIAPIQFDAKADTLKTLNHFVHLNEMVKDTLTNNGDPLIIERKGSKVAFIIKQKPKEIKVYAKKTDHKKEAIKTKNKDVKRTNYIPIALICIVIIVIVFFIRRFVK